MTVNNPLVSICIPAYNCDRYIGQTLQCLGEQTYRNLEIIVVNDGSADETEARVKAIGNSLTTLISTHNGGAAHARNIAYEQSKGDYLIFFDADDLVEPDFIQKQVNKINGRDNVVVLSAWGRFYGDDVRTFKADTTPGDEMTFKEWIKLYWYKGNPMTNPGRVIIPRALLQQAGLWNKDLNLNDDLEFFTRVFMQAGQIVFNPAAMLSYRSGINGLSSKKTASAWHSLFNAINLSVNHVLTGYEHDPALLKACANMWQLFIYDLFPHHSELLKAATQKVKQLKGSDLKFPSGGYARMLTAVIGWKNTKRLKNALCIS